MRKPSTESGVKKSRKRSASTGGVLNSDSDLNSYLNLDSSSNSNSGGNLGGNKSGKRRKNSLISPKKGGKNKNSINTTINANINTNTNTNTNTNNNNNNTNSNVNDDDLNDEEDEEDGDGDGDGDGSRNDGFNLDDSFSNENGLQVQNTIGGGTITFDKRTSLNDEHEREKQRLLLACMTPDQMNRYEVFRRVKFSKASIKRLLSSALNQSASKPILIAVSGFAKVFVGEIIERARDVQIRELILALDDYSKNNIPATNIDINDNDNDNYNDNIDLNHINDTNNGGYNLQTVTKEIPIPSPEDLASMDLGPLKPHHIKEAWRLYKLENPDLYPKAVWRQQGGGAGLFFR